jgi:AraC-like DNA-binding protein
MRGSTISSWALLIAKALDAAGHDSHSAFDYAGVDYGKLSDPDARYSYESMQRLWRVAVGLARDPYFGLTVASFWHPTTLHALGYSWMASDSLRDAFTRMARYGRLVTTVAEIQFEEGEDYFDFRVNPRYDVPKVIPEAVDAGLATFVRMCRISYGEGFHPARILTQRERPVDPERYMEFFRAPVEFSQPENVLYFSKESLEKSLPTANPRLARVNDQVITEYLAKFDQGSTAIRVRAYLVEHLPAGKVTQQRVAKALHMSLRTLQRKLADEATSYKDLLDETRRELAGQYLRQNCLSVSEVTYLLGFSEPSNFARAFKRWTGRTPSEFRTVA